MKIYENKIAVQQIDCLLLPFHALLKLSRFMCNILFYKKTTYKERTLPFELNNVTKCSKRASIFWRVQKHFCLLDHKLPETFTCGKKNFFCWKLFSPAFSLNEWMSEHRSDVFKFSANWYRIHFPRIASMCMDGKWVTKCDFTHTKKSFTKIIFGLIYN